MRFFCVALSLFLLCPTYVLSISISEVMYNPIASDDYSEWIEIYSDVSLDLTNATLCGSKLMSGYLNHSDRKTYDNFSSVLPANSYAIITDGGTGTDAYVNYNISGIAFHVTTSSLCGGLTDSGKSIFIEKDGFVLENITYVNIAHEGNSISKKEGVFIESIPSPGIENIFLSSETVNQTQNQTNGSLSQQLSQNATTINNSSIQNQTNSEYNYSLQNNSQNNTVPNENNFSINASSNSDVCDWNVSLIFDKSFYQANEDFSFKVKSEKLFGDKTNISASVKIYNSDGVVVADYLPYVRSEVTYSKTSQEYHPDVFGKLTLRAHTETDCLDNVSTNNFIEKFIEVNSTPKIINNTNLSIASSKIQNKSHKDSVLVTQNSTLEFVDFSDENKLEILLYRGNTSNYAVHFLALCDQEKCSDEMFHLNHKFTEISLFVPFSKKCVKNYNFSLSGLDNYVETNFFRNVSINSCNNQINFNQSIITSSSKEKNQITADVISNQTQIFESPNKAAKDVAIIFLLILSIVFNVILIWKR